MSKIFSLASTHDRLVFCVSIIWNRYFHKNLLYVHHAINRLCFAKSHNDIVESRIFLDSWILDVSDISYPQHDGLTCVYENLESSLKH